MNLALRPVTIRNRKKQRIWLLTIGLLLIVAFVKTFICCITVVDGNSMYPTLKDHEIYIVKRFNYVPSRKDIVLIQMDSPIGGRRHIVKRIIAVGGETLRINYMENEIYVNEQLIEEPYINLAFEDPMMGEETSDVRFTVPEGYVFVMGDNRNCSIDSRNKEIGAIAEADVIGKVIFCFWGAK